MSKKIMTTRNYRMFSLVQGENRGLEIEKHRKLKKSMETWGFIDDFPIICYRDQGKLIIKDGQHRYAFAEELGLPIHYVVTDIDFDVADLNTTLVKWNLKAHIQKHADSGNEHYKRLLAFAEEHEVPVSVAASVLVGHSTNSNSSKMIPAGTFKIKEYDFAVRVVTLYKSLVAISSNARRKVMLEACSAVFRVKSFDPARLLTRAKRCAEKLQAYSNRDDCLRMIEDIYNFGSKQLFGLKAEALNALKVRQPIKKTAKKDVA